jgi:hypothetical protein
LDGVQNHLREREEEINRDYEVMKGMTCKGQQPALLPVILDPAAAAAL